MKKVMIVGLFLPPYVNNHHSYRYTSQRWIDFWLISLEFPEAPPIPTHRRRLLSHHEWPEAIWIDSFIIMPFLQTQSERSVFRGFGSKGYLRDFVHVMRMQMHQSAVSRLTWSLQQLKLVDLWWLSFVVARHAHILIFRSADRRC